MRRTAVACLLAVTGLLVPAAGAAAKDWAIGFPTGTAPMQYSPNTYTIQQGDTVTWTGSFSNHPLVSGEGAWSTVMSGPSFTFQFNAAGTYNFNCLKHPMMMFGTITVQAQPPGGGGGGGGQPQPGPGQPPPPGGQPPAGQATDSVAPTVALSAVATRSPARNGVLVRFRSSEPGSALATLKAKGRTLGTARVSYALAGVHSVRVKLNRTAKALLKRSRKLKVTLTLVIRDAAGNAAPRVTRTLTLRP